MVTHNYLLHETFLQNYLNVFYNLLLHFLEWLNGYAVLQIGQSGFEPWLGHCIVVFALIVPLFT